MNDIMTARIIRLDKAWREAEERRDYGSVDAGGRYPEAYGWLASAVKTFLEECKADASPNGGS